MSTGPAVATATVRIVPDTTGFRAELQRQVDLATKGVTASVQAQVASTAAAANAAAVSGVTRGTSGAGGRVAAGTRAAAAESNALRGALIGLSRVTPVTVFGLGVAGTAAIAVGYAMKGAIRSTADFEHELNVFQATTGATAAEMVLVSEKAKALGADLTLPSTSAGDAASAMTELAKAGLTVNDTLAGSTGVLQLAAAAQIDVGTAATFVATELNAFGLAGDQATHVADLLTGASVAAQGEITDFGTAFQQVSAVAKQADVSIETTTGALVELAKAGLKGADGGTSLRTALLRLTPTTKQAAQFQKALGIELDQTKTIGEQLPGLLDQYKNALAGLTPIQRQQTLTQIFGQDAYRAAAILIEGGSKALERNTAKANENGAAARIAAANAKGLSGAFNGLKSNLDTLGITLGGFVSGPLEAFVRGTSDGVTAVGELAIALGNLKLPDFLGGGGGKDKGDSGPTAAFKRLFTPLGTVVSDVAAFIKVANKGGFVKFGETPKEALARIEAEEKAQKNLAKAQQAGKFGTGGFLPSKGLKDQVTAGQFGITNLGTPIKLTAKQKKAAAEIRALIEGDKKPKPIDVTAPNRLLIAQDQAVLDGSLQAELKADKAIEAYFAKRLKLAKKGSDRYTAILGALRAANSATLSVQSQIASESKAAAEAAKQAMLTGIQNQQTKLEIAADESGRSGSAEKALIAFYKKQSENLKLTEAQRLVYKKSLDGEVKSQKALVVALSKSQIDLRSEILATKLSAALLTPTKKDEERVYRLQIADINADIKRQRRIARAISSSAQERIDALTKIQKDLQAINALKGTIKGLKGADSGFSLQDLFKESVNQFNEFSSNVSSRPQTVGGARAALAGANLAAMSSKLTYADKLKLEKAAETNSLLYKMLHAIQPEAAPKGPTAAQTRKKFGMDPAGYGASAYAAYYAARIGAQ